MDGILSQPATLFLAAVGRLFKSRIALENAYLRQENKILRGKLGRCVPLSETERVVLVRYGLPIRDRLADIISIVKPETLLAWHRRMKKTKWTFDNTPKKPGRPKTPEQTESLVLKIARQNNRMGYIRIAGELKKLGHCLAPTTVANILKKHGLPPRLNEKACPGKRLSSLT